MKRSCLSFASALLIAVAACSSLRTKLGDTWALSDGTKIKQNDSSHALKGGNCVFNRNGPSIKLFPSENRGFDGPMTSTRLKNWRRGIETVEHLVLAKAAGAQALVGDVLDNLLPTALDDGSPGDTKPVVWVEDGEIWLRQR